MSNVFDLIADVFDGLCGKQKKNTLSELGDDSFKDIPSKGLHPDLYSGDSPDFDTALYGSSYDDQQAKLAESKRDRLFSTRFKF